MFNLIYKVSSLKAIVSPLDISNQLDLFSMVKFTIFLCKSNKQTLVYEQESYIRWLARPYVNATQITIHEGDYYIVQTVLHFWNSPIDKCKLLLM